MIPITNARNLDNVLTSTELPVKIFYNSIWDKISNDLYAEIDESFLNNGENTDNIYSIDSWNFPEAFPRFGINKVPALVIVGDKKTTVLDHPTRIRKYFSLSRDKSKYR